ncbi:MAG: hypothetical protein R3D30_11505 [Hyphomicrobiales bacterium]
MSCWPPRTLAGAPFKVELDCCDFVEALTKRRQPSDVSWCSLSIHHLPTDGKRKLLESIHGSTAEFLMIYEPTMADGEDRDTYLARFRQVNRPLWSYLTPEEWSEIDHHVTTCDLPETAATWITLGREAGFPEASQLFLDPTASTASTATIASASKYPHLCGTTRREGFLIAFQRGIEK